MPQSLGRLPRRSVIAVACAALLAGCWPARSESTISQDEFLRRLGEVTGVTGVTSQGSPWVVEVDPRLSGDELQSLSQQAFDLFNQASLDPLPTVELRAGTATAQLERRHTGGGPQPVAPELRWIAWLRGDRAVRALRVDRFAGHVTLAPGTDLLAWAVALADSGRVTEEAPYLWAGTSKDAALSLPIGKPDAQRKLHALSDVLRSTGATLVKARLDITADISVTVDDHAAAKAFVAACTTAFGDPNLVDLTLATPNGTRWSGELTRIGEVLDTSQGVPALLAECDAVLTSTSDRGSYSISVPDPRSAAKVVELVTSSRWTPGPDSRVSIRLVGTANGSSGSPAVWAQAGPVWLDALERGLTQTIVHGPGGGSHERTFDITFMADSKGPDLTTPEGYRAIIEVLRGHDWTGEAQVTLGYDDHLIFWTSATGKAQDAYFALHGAKSRKPTGWAVDFLTAFDATATS